MTEPKFKVGDLVAVFSLEPLVCVPNTEIIDTDFVAKGECRTLDGGRRCRSIEDCWFYRVADDPDWFYQEKYIRKINPDEYAEKTENQEISA